METFLKNSIEGKTTVEEQVKFLENFTIEKVKAKDVTLFVNFMRKHMSGKVKMPGAIDVCGTGGSGLPRINTSTISAFLLARMGIKVAKHGNRAASGRFGSFDLLEAMGVPNNFRDKNLAFIFARDFHPAMKCFAEARIKIGKPTIFNILGPLLNPADPKMQIIGTSFEEQMRAMAEACKMLGKKRVMVVRGEDGLDEVTLTGRTKVVELKDGKIAEYFVSPVDFGLKKANFKDIAGGDKNFNLKIALKILSGKCKSRHADLVYMNCAMAMKLVGITDDLKEAYEMIKNQGNFLEKIAKIKHLNKSDRNFTNALKRHGTAIIAEIKRTSPSAGTIFRGDFDAAEIAKEYEKNGASAISVVTDEKFFDGSFDYLRAAKMATKKIPILCKDFIIHEYQIYKAREYGANAVLLITNLLSVKRLKELIKTAKTLGMECLVEIHDKIDLKKALDCGAKIIGINNRDLRTFIVDLNTTNRLIRLIPKGKIIVSESGIHSSQDLKRLNKRVNAALIGSAFMSTKNLKNKFDEFKKISAK